MFKQNPSILIFFFFRVKTDATLSSKDVKFLLNQRRETQDRTLIDINHHYQITMNQHKN